MIGDQSPSIWVMSQAKEKILSLRENPYHPAKYRSVTVNRTLSYNVVTGECVGREKPPGGDKKNYVTIMVSVSCENKEGFPNTTIVFDRWADDGMSALGKEGPFGISSFDNLVEEGAPLFVVTLFNLIKFAKEDLYICSTCKKELPNPPVGRHFAGTYCKVCWEIFKRKNSRTCNRCRKPMYECYC